MTLIEKIRKKSGGVIFYKYCGVNDLATSHDVKFVVENQKLLMLTFDEKLRDSSIKHLDELRLYFLAKKYDAISETIPYIVVEDNKKLVKDLSLLCHEYINKVNLGSVIKYINASYKRVFNKNKLDYELFDVVLDFVFEYGNGINEDVWIFLADKYGYKLLYNYPKIKKRLCNEKYGPEMLDKMINIKTPNHLIGCHLEDVFNVLTDIIINHPTGELFHVARQKVDQIYEVVDSLKEDDVTERDLLIKDRIYRDTLNFLKTIKDKRANGFSVKTKLLGNKLGTWLQKNGKSIGYEIPIGEIINQWRTNENWEVRLLSLTHELRKTDNIVATSRIAECEKPKTILDFCSVNFPTDDYFTYSLQMSLQIYSVVGSGTILGLLHNDEDIEEYYKLITSAVYHIRDNVKNSFPESLLQDVDMLINSIETIRRNKNNGDIRMLYYGASMLACAVAEKILKMTIENEMYDIKYIQTNNLDLGSMLNPDIQDNPLISIFGDNHLKHLAFFLCTSGNKRIGHEYRNNLAHLSGDIEERLNNQLLTQLLWILTDILNTVFWYYCGPKKHPLASRAL